MIRRFNAFTDRHPILSMIGGAIVLIALAMQILPPDPPYVDAAMHGRTT